MKKTLKDLEKLINEHFHKKYKNDKTIYDKYRVENIIYNDKSHLVSTFKDYLLMDEHYEFLKRFYNGEESTNRLIKYIEYYEKYNFLFPNYTALPESEYLYQNINRKQIVIDIQQNDNKMKQIKKEEGQKNSQKNLNINLSINDSNKIFDSKVYESILKSANKSSCFSQFGVDKNNEKLDSIGDIKQLITEINNVPSSEMNNIIKLDDSPAHPMHNNNFFILNENFNNNVNKENNDRKFSKFIYNTNYCYNKFKNRNIKNLLYNNKNDKNIDIPISNNKINSFSPLYKKVKIKQKTLSKIPNFKINDPIPNIINNLKNIKNNTIYINKNNSNSKYSFVYRKFSPMNKNNNLNFSTKNNNKESLKTITYFPLNKKSSINQINPMKKNSLKIKYNFNDIKSKIINLNNYSTKNNTINNINRQNLENLYLNTAENIRKKFLYSNCRTQTELDNNLKISNFFNFLPIENTVYKFCENFAKENSNLGSSFKKNTKVNQINRNFYKNLKSFQNRTKSLSINKNSINNIVKPYITDSIIDSISNRIKKENQNYISKRIYNIINNKNNKTNIKSTNNNAITLKKQLKTNKMQKNKNNYIIANKLISSIDKNLLYNKDTLRSFTYNSSNSNNINHINKVPINNFKKKYINTYTTPNSIKKHISFKQFINNNFSTINNTYNCQLFTNKDDINKANYTLYSTKNKKTSDNNKNKFIYDTCNLNNKNLNTITGFRNKKLVINTDTKKKILIVKKKEKKINTNNYSKNNNKNIINNNKNKNKKSHKNKTKSNTLKIREYEKIKIIEPKQTWENIGYLNNNNNRTLLKTQILNHKIVKKLK